MTLQDRDRRALILLAAAVVMVFVVRALTGESEEAVVAPMAVESIPAAERRLTRLREIVATVPGRKLVAEGMAAQAAEREKGLIAAETAAQAQAQLLQIVRKLARAQAPPLEISQNELGAIQPLGDDYGEALVSVTMTCRIEQLVNLLADIMAQPELIATHEMRVSAGGDAKQKTINVRLTVSGVIPRKLVPERKGLGSI
jgi:hypothetical protein